MIFLRKNITQFIGFVKIVLVDMNIDCCLTEKFNQTVDLNSSKTIDLCQRKSVISMQGDFTSQDDEIYKFLTYYNRVLIALYIMYGPVKPEGLVLPIFIRYDDIVKEIIPVEF